VVNAPLTTSQLLRLRHRAHSHGLGADAFVALVVEWQFLMDLVGADSLKHADAHARGPAVPISLAAAEFQAWQRVLMGLAAPPPDDLPETHLPLRLAAALPPDKREDAVLAAVDLAEPVVEQAVALELAATRHGLTMQTWVLSLR
jgi:hypothetical protein